MCRARIAFESDQRRHQAISTCSLTQVFSLFEALVEEYKALLGRALRGLEFRTHELKFNTIGHLTVAQVLDTILHVGDTVYGERMSAQVRGSRTLVKSRCAQQPLKERCGSIRIESRFFEYLKSDTILLLFIRTGEIEYALHGTRL